MRDDSECVEGEDARTKGNESECVDREDEKARMTSAPSFCIFRVQRQKPKFPLGHTVPSLTKNDPTT